MARATPVASIRAMHTHHLGVRRASLILLVAATLNCGDRPTEPQPQPQPALQGTAAPSPIALAPCPPANCGSSGPAQLELLTTITLRETGGVAGRVDNIVATLRRNNDNGVVATATITADAVRVNFQASGTATIPFALHVNQADVIAQSTLTLVINATASSRGVSTTLTVPVNGPTTSAGLSITANYQIVQSTITTSCGDTGAPATVTGWVTLTGPDTFQLRDTGGTTFNGSVAGDGRFSATAVFGPDAGGQTFTQRLEGTFTSGGGFTGRLDVAVTPRNCAFARTWTGTRSSS